MFLKGSAVKICFCLPFKRFWDFCQDRFFTYLSLTSNLLLQLYELENWTGWSPGKQLHVEEAAIHRSRAPEHMLLSGQFFHPQLSCLPDAWRYSNKVNNE